MCTIMSAAVSFPATFRGKDVPQGQEGGCANKSAKGYQMHKTIYSPKHVVELARKMRSDLTAVEKILWDKLRKRQIAGLQFRRQHPIDRYIADFCCLGAKLVIELDGESHCERKEYDINRDEYLSGCGYTVLRFKNEDVLHRIENVLDVIRSAVEQKAP